MPIESDTYAEWIENNLSAKSLDFASLPGGKSYACNPTWFTSGIKRAGYNGITRAEFEPDGLDSQIEFALEPFRQTRTPLTWWVGPRSSPAKLGQALQAHGFFHNRDMIGMATELSDLAPVPISDLDYRFEQVTDRAGLEAWMPLFAATFGLAQADFPLTLDIFSQLSFRPYSQWHHYALILPDGEVVATSSLHLGAGIAGLYNIAVHPAYHRNGLGAAITTLTYAQAREMGYKTGTLQTTYPNALRLYHRLGFEVYCKIGVYQRIW
jgi:ribosomal protein S18 acetylase RimI-like enzyme